MGMFDWYKPDPPLACRACAAELRGWQGKDGPCRMLVWTQGVPAAIHDVDDQWKMAVATLNALRLPERFYFWTTCDQCNRTADATGFAVDGIWRTTLFGNYDASIIATSLGEGWRECSGCGEVWEAGANEALLHCRGCYSLTRVELNKDQP